MSLQILDDMQYEPYKPPDNLKIPHGFTVFETESSYNIEHFRAGMGCLNLFLICWLVGWIIGIFVIIIPIVIPAEGLHFGTYALFAPLIIVPPCLVYSICAKKSFALGETTLTVKTRVLVLSWEITLPRETIIHLTQVKDGGEGRDNFPSWGLRIKSASSNKNFISHIISLIRFGRDVRYRSLLSRLPYEHSYWLGITVSRWADARLDLLPRSPWGFTDPSLPG